MRPWPQSTAAAGPDLSAIEADVPEALPDRRISLRLRDVPVNSVMGLGADEEDMRWPGPSTASARTTARRRENGVPADQPGLRMPGCLTRRITCVISAWRNYARKRMQISEAESVVMQALWERHPLASEEVVAALAGAREWQEPTIKTLLNRLLKKGAVTAAKDGRRYLYSPALRRGDWLAQQSGNLVDRLFGGRVAPLVAHFSEQRQLSAADIAELRSLLEKLDDDGR